MQYIKNNKFFVNPLNVGNKQIVNPTHEQLVAEGWQVYEPPTPSAEAQRLAEIDALKEQLAATDYKAIKFAEGWLTPEEYARTKDERQQLRDRINELEGEYASE